jgi:DUF1680 family protein
MAVYVNGKKTMTGNPGTYVNLSREWKNGDVISFDLPMNFKATRYEGSEKNYNDGQHYVLEYGPVVMAALNVGKLQREISIHTNTFSIRAIKEQIIFNSMLLFDVMKLKLRVIAYFFTYRLFVRRLFWLFNNISGLITIRR